MPVADAFSEPGASAGHAQALVGRDEELDLIKTFLEEAATGGTALLVTGEAGLGKSVLLDAADRLATAAGIRVLRATGRERDAQASFSGLDQVLTPLGAGFDQLSATYRHALAVARGLGQSPQAGQLVLCNAVVDLLRRTARARPTLVIFDDLQWVDQDSAVVLASVARRLARTRIGFIAASRPSSHGPFAQAGLVENTLRPLDEESAARLIEARFPELASSVRRRVLAEAQGNPLALVELPTALSREQRTAVDPLPQVLPLNRRLSGLFAARIGELSATSRVLLLLASLEGSGDLEVVEAAAHRHGGLGHLISSELASLENTHLVSFDGGRGRLAFRHPLVRSAVVEASTGLERRHAHRALAEALADQPDRQVWHLAEAALQPQQQVADLLEQSARSHLNRGDAVGAVTALTRAAGLSRRRSDRARLLVEAASIDAEVTGHLGNVSRRLADARLVGTGPAGSLRAATATSYLLLSRECDIDSAHRLLVRAISAYGDSYDADDEALIDALHCLLMICWFGGRSGLWRPFEDAVDRIAPAPPDLLAVCADTFGDPVHRAMSSHDQLATLLTSLPGELNPVQITRTGIACVYVDRLADCREALSRVVRDGREDGAVGLAINALMSSCIEDWLTGQWDEALNLAAEGVAMSEARGYRLYPAILSGYIRALILVVRGDAQRGLGAADDLAEWARTRGVGVAVTFAHHVRTLGAIAAGDFEQAYLQASAVSQPGVLSPHNQHALWVLLDLVESAVRTGRRAEAIAHVAAMRAADIAAISPRLELITAGSAAIASSGADASKLYEEALDVAGDDRWPFELARVQLAYGEHLRRARAVVESRRHLKAAGDIFRRLGADPWTRRASDDLRAAGLPMSRPRGEAAQSLTPQEREIATLASTGLTNKQIARRLHLSHRTVGAHLYAVFPKLGVTSRAALRDALAAAGSLAAPRGPATARTQSVDR